MTRRVLDFECPTCSAWAGEPCYRANPAKVFAPDPDAMHRKTPHPARAKARRDFLRDEPCEGCGKPTAGEVWRSRAYVDGFKSKRWTCADCVQARSGIPAVPAVKLSRGDKIWNGSEWLRVVSVPFRGAGEVSLELAPTFHGPSATRIFQKVASGRRFRTHTVAEQSREGGSTC